MSTSGAAVNLKDTIEEMNLSIIRLLRQQMMALTRMVPSGVVGIAALYYFFPSFRVFARDLINYVIWTARSVTGL